MKSIGRRAKIDVGMVIRMRTIFATTTSTKDVVAAGDASMTIAVLLVQDAGAAIEDEIGTIEVLQRLVATAGHLTIVIAATEGIAPAGTKWMSAAIEVAMPSGVDTARSGDQVLVREDVNETTIAMTIGTMSSVIANMMTTITAARVTGGATMTIVEMSAQNVNVPTEETA